MRTALCGLMLVVLCSTFGFAADSFRADAEAAGTVVLWFEGQNVTADVRADVSLSGSLFLAGASTTFTVTARASGKGRGNLDTLAVDAWIAFSGRGETASGAALSVRGGISLTKLDTASSGSPSGQGSGRFYLLFTTPEGSWVVEGDAVGGASGSFVVPDDPLSMQAAGAGTFTLTGEPGPWDPTVDEPLPEWPAELLAELERQDAEVEEAE